MCFGIKKKDTGKYDESSDKSTITSLFAAMIQNTSETKETLMRYTIPELEEMVEAISKQNDGSSNEKTDANAMDELLKMTGGGR